MLIINFSFFSIPGKSFGSYCSTIYKKGRKYNFKHFGGKKNLFLEEVLNLKGV